MDSLTFEPKKKSNHNITFIVVLLGLLVLASTAILYHVGLVVISCQERMMKVRTVDDDLSEFISNLKDAETGQRGYLLTDQAIYLEPYNKAVLQIQADIKKLKRDVLAGLLPEELVNEVIGLTQDKLAELKSTINLCHDKKLPAAIAIVDSDYGKNRMDLIRSAVSSMKEDSNNQFLEAKVTAQKSTNYRSVAFIMLAVLNLFALAGAYKKITKQITLNEKQTELLVTTLASIGDAVIVTDQKAGVMFLNPEAVRMTGWENAQAYGKPLQSIFKIINEKSRQPVENPVEKVFRLGHIVGLANHTVLISKDGRETPIDDSAAPILHTNGSILGVVLVFRDFTQFKMDQQALQRSNEELEQFAYAASHDLQEPLRTIALSVDLLLKRDSENLNTKEKSYLNYIQKSAAHAQELVRSLLEYANIGNKDYPFELTDLNELLNQAVLNLKAAIDESKARVTYDPLSSLAVNSVQIKQLFQNLISNSIKYKGKECPQIHISAKQDNLGWIFSVKDNGIGIDSQYHDRIFTIFKRLHSRDAYPGIGIGLAVCKKIVQRHGGRIWVESEPGKGSTFYFSLPLRRDSYVA